MRCLHLRWQEPVFENVDLGTTIVRVSAADADSGLFAVVEYSLVDGEGKFGIKPSTVSELIQHYQVHTTPRQCWLLTLSLILSGTESTDKVFTSLHCTSFVKRLNKCVGVLRAAPAPVYFLPNSSLSSASGRDLHPFSS